MLYSTPKQLQLSEGKYAVTVPSTWKEEGILYKFWSWENGEKNTKRILNLTSDMTIKVIYEPVSREKHVNSTLYTLKKLEFSIEHQKILEDKIRKLEINVNGLNYYPPEDLRILKEHYEITEESPFFMFKRRLEDCPTGREHWKEYQDICKDIFTNIFVPPLEEPKVEKETRQRIQRRDLIFHIPHQIEDSFWKYILETYSSLAIIVECKNYSKKLGQNNFTTTSKYFGKKRLGLFGIIVTRKGLNPNSKEEQTRLWIEDHKMIICLNDLDLINILKLKDKGEKPQKIIDEKIRSFRESL